MKKEKKVETKEFRLKIGLRNNLLITQRESRGMTQKQLAAAIGIPTSTVARYESFAETPLKVRGGGWKDGAIKLAEGLQLLPEDLWPGSALAVKKANAILVLDSTEMELLTGQFTLESRTPEDYCLESERSSVVQGMLDKLTDRERYVVERRFGVGCSEQTLDEISEDLERCQPYNVKEPTNALSSTRVAQIEARALLRLRHSSVSKAAKDFVQQ